MGCRYKNVPLDKYPRQHRLRETLRSKGVGRHISEEAVRLLERMLCLDPKRRITAADAVMVRIGHRVCSNQSAHDTASKLVLTDLRRKGALYQSASVSP